MDSEQDDSYGVGVGLGGRGTEQKCNIFVSIDIKPYQSPSLFIDQFSSHQTEGR